MFKLFKKDTAEEIEVTVSNKTVLRVLLLVFGAILFLAALRQASHALVLIFTAIFLALALNAPVQWIARHMPGKSKGNRTAATAVSFLLVILLLGAFIASIVPPLIKQTQNFITAAPGLIEDSKDTDSTFGRFIAQYRLQGQVDKFSEEIDGRLTGVGSAAISSIGRIGTSVISVLTILVLTFMLLIEGPRLLAFLRELVHTTHRDHVDSLATQMYKVIKGYVNGQVTLAAIAALFIAPVFFVMGVNYPIALVVIVFISGLIPMVGHTIGAVIVSLVALATSPIAALVVLAYYILYQQIENYIVQPRVQANSTNMSPLLVFGSVVIGVSFGGLAGGLFAIPVAGCIRIAVLDYLRNHDYISDKPTVADEVKKAVKPKSETAADSTK